MKRTVEGSERQHDREVRHGVSWRRLTREGEREEERSQSQGRNNELTAIHLDCLRMEAAMTSQCSFGESSGLP